MRRLAARHELSGLTTATTSRPLRRATARHAWAKVTDGSWLRERVVRTYAGRSVGPSTDPDPGLSQLLQPRTPRRSIRRT